MNKNFSIKTALIIGLSALILTGCCNKKPKLRLFDFSDKDQQIGLESMQHNNKKLHQVGERQKQKTANLLRKNPQPIYAPDSAF